jgi:hypothetical protein
MPDLETAIGQMDYTIGEIVKLGANQDSGEGLSDLTLLARAVHDLWKLTFKPLLESEA